VGAETIHASYGSWIYNYLCNQCLSSLQLWVRTPFMGHGEVYSIQHYVIMFVSDLDSCKSNYHTITTTTASSIFGVSSLFKDFLKQQFHS
jgi:hypothetical protein